MGGEETATMLPEQGPDVGAIGLGNLEGKDLVARNEPEGAFAVGWGKGCQTLFDLEEEHEPVSLPEVTVLTDHRGQVEVGGVKFQSEFFLRLATGAAMGRLTQILLELSSAGTPQAAIGFLGALEEEDFVGVIEGVEQGGDLVR